MAPRKKKGGEVALAEPAPAVLEPMVEPDWPAADAAANSAGSYAAAIDAIRMEGVRAGRFLPRPGNAAEIKASPIVRDARRIGPCTLYLGDSTQIVPLLAEGGAPWIDACVSDPPYELGFMGKGWDSSGVAADWRTWGGVRIALKPGAHLVAFAGSRTYHRIATAVEDAGFDIRDQIARFFAELPQVREFLRTLRPEQAAAVMRLVEERGFGGIIEWIYGSGFPKSLDVSKSIDKAGGVWRGRAGAALPTGDRALGTNYQRSPKGEAVFDDAKRWDGWGTALKPAHEPVVFARKPLAEGTVAANVLAWATGALNIDAARVASGQDHADKCASVVGLASPRSVTAYSEFRGQRDDSYNAAGRWPANVVTDGSLEVLEAFPPSARDAIRFFYAAKADKGEREEGLATTAAVTKRADAGVADGGRGGADRANIHPTVKPVDLMRWLCRLVTPPGGTVLDPFMGSGTTGIAAVREGCQFVGIEQDAEYFEIACQRIEHAVRLTEAEPDLVREITRAVVKARGGGQVEMF